METQDEFAGNVEGTLNSLSGGLILDVATGGGGFITYLMENLKDYAKIIGIDCNESRLEAARKSHIQDNIRFQCMDAAHMGFPDAHFDTVCIANSMHHMDDLPGVLSEIMRVCKAGGTIIISETYRDGQTKAQLTNIKLHDWWAAVDTAQGITHHKTFTLRQIIQYMRKLNLDQVKYYKDRDLESDPRDPELIQELDSIIDRFIQRSQALPGREDLSQRGEQLRQRVHTVGFHGATSLIMIGKK